MNDVRTRSIGSGCYRRHHPYRIRSCCGDDNTTTVRCSTGKSPITTIASVPVVFFAVLLILSFVSVVRIPHDQHSFGMTMCEAWMITPFTATAPLSRMIPSSSSSSSLQQQQQQHYYNCNHPVTTQMALRMATTVSSDTPTTVTTTVVPPTADIPVVASSTTTGTTSNSNILSDNSKRGKMNEIDYCIAPADVSLSRAYGTSTSRSSSSSTGSAVENDENDNHNIMAGLSLTRALNNASNRAVRRIILVPSWPSPDDFNESLRRVAAMELAAQQQLREQQQLSSLLPSSSSSSTNTDAKCPVPRPILNVLTRKGKTTESPKEEETGDDASNAAPTGTGTSGTTSTTSSSATSSIRRKSRTDEEYVLDQIQSFRNMYGTLEGYPYAEEYLYCLLALATSGIESPYVSQVQSNGIYQVAYQRILAVLQTVGVEWEWQMDIDEKESDNNSVQGSRRRKIAKRLKDQDICLSVLDQLQLRHGQEMTTTMIDPINDNDVVKIAATPSENRPTAEPVMAVNDKDTTINMNQSKDEPTNETLNDEKKKWWEVWKSTTKNNDDGTSSRNDAIVIPNSSSNDNDVTRVSTTTATSTTTTTGILLSMTEPTMTRQLNVLSNIVLRVLLFGGDQELLVVAETLRSDVPIFQQRWYPSTAVTAGTKSLSGVDYINCMIQLLQNCYNSGVVTDLNPPIPLSSSFANAYERLVATAVELGSGYLKPVPFALQQQQSNGVNTAGSVTATSTGSTSAAMESNIGLVASIPKPRTAQEELGRFALLESNFRQAQQLSSPSAPGIYTPYPMDLVGQWEVRDEISGEIIGSSVVTFLENGNVQVPPPLEGLRWRLDPGPTHLDTCTFQVLSTIDRTILQYRGFIDRGARLEARFSKRPIRIRGSVMFQMREGGSIDYYKDMLPINYRTGTTKFVMTKITK